MSDYVMLAEKEVIVMRSLLLYFNVSTGSYKKSLKQT